MYRCSEIYTCTSRGYIYSPIGVIHEIDEQRVIAYKASIQNTDPIHSTHMDLTHTNNHRINAGWHYGNHIHASTRHQAPGTTELPLAQYTSCKDSTENSRRNRSCVLPEGRDPGT